MLYILGLHVVTAHVECCSLLEYRGYCLSTAAVIFALGADTFWLVLVPWRQSIYKVFCSLNPIKPVISSSA
ncbi:hypothetical protein B0J17DRAFT_654766 [Rhizoctonia solani]|nr:hypothetical protein B0J17DRAFT_654766 [Rhizoctonia solani]